MGRKLSLFFLLLASFYVAVATSVGFAMTPQIDVLKAKGIINPVMAGYIERGIREAESRQAVAVIIQLDTPGGLDTSMRDIVKSILESRVPVVVYVSPSGGRAASAGVFITMAAHIAAMAPQTTIGAAHPVAMSSSGVTQLPPEIEDKVLNDAVAYIKTIASHRGRNEVWAESAVRESVMVRAEEAWGLNVVDLVATNLDDLRVQLDGKEVIVHDAQGTGTQVTLNTQGAIFNYNGMNFGERFLLTITDPNIAYILLSLGMLAIFLELSNPGAILPGVVGGVFLLLALYSLGTLDAYWGGLLLIAFAFGLFVADIFVTSHGILTAGAVVSLALGSLLLFSGGSSLFRIDPWLIAAVVVAFTAFFIFIIGAAVQAHKRRATTGMEGLVGKTATALSALDPKGIVFVEGERWTAFAEGSRIEPKEEVIVSKVEGLTLWVKRNKPG